MSFESDVRQFSENAKARAVRIVKSSALELFKRIVSRTPVDTGRARANWQIDLNGISENAGVNFQGERGEPRDKEDHARRDMNAARATQEAISKGTAKVEGGVDEHTRKICIFNNVVYIIPLEYGHSKKQAPEGMVRISVAEWPQIVAQFTQGLRS